MLRMLFDASASGLLRTLKPDPFDPKDVQHLRHVLHRLRTERYLRYTTRELLTALVKQTCMAVANRDRYRSAHEDVTRLLTYLRELDLPGNGEPAPSDFEQIIDLWVRTFGNPDEMERKQRERDESAGPGETEEERLEREMQEFVLHHYLRQ